MGAWEDLKNAVGLGAKAEPPKAASGASGGGSSGGGGSGGDDDGDVSQESLKVEFQEQCFLLSFMDLSILYACEKGIEVCSSVLVSTIANRISGTICAYSYGVNFSTNACADFFMLPTASTSNFGGDGTTRSVAASECAEGSVPS